jgi:hypothetical protein
MSSTWTLLSEAEAIKSKTFFNDSTVLKSSAFFATFRYIDNKLDDTQKSAKLNALDDEIADFELKKASATEEVTDKEQVVVAALMLITRSD